MLKKIQHVRKIREDRAGAAVLIATRASRDALEQGERAEAALAQSRVERYSHTTFRTGEPMTVQEIELGLAHYHYLLNQEKENGSRLNEKKQAAEEALQTCDSAKATYRLARSRREKLEHVCSELLAAEREAEAAKEEEQAAEVAGFLSRSRSDD